MRWGATPSAVLQRLIQQLAGRDQILQHAFEPGTVGLANALTQVFAQMVLNTTHPSVGAGGGAAKFLAPPAAPSILQGFQQAGMKGGATDKKAKALGRALDMTFAVLVMPVGIVGPPSISPGAGSGFGGIA